MDDALDGLIPLAASWVAASARKAVEEPCSGPKSPDFPGVELTVKIIDWTLSIICMLFI
jgi:hypothetical protein